MTPLHPISLATIRAAGPCEDGWLKLLKSLGRPPKSEWPNIYVTLGDIAASNGVPDAWWCVRCLPDEARRDVVRALLPCVRRASAHTTDQRVHDGISAIERWVSGDETVDLGPATWAAAWVARQEAAEASAVAAAAAAEAAGAAAAAAATERQHQAADLIAVFGRVERCRE
jgi:hypothetical protein